MSNGLNFPNPSRSYDEKEHCIRFWGYDKTIEVLFSIQEDALLKLHPSIAKNKAEFLSAFDVNCDKIRKAASKAYSLQRRSAYALTAADF